MRASTYGRADTGGVDAATIFEATLRPWAMTARRLIAYAAVASSAPSTRTPMASNGPRVRAHSMIALVFSSTLDSGSLPLSRA